MPKYPDVRRNNPLIPWGYAENPDDSMIFTPIEDHLDAFEQAKVYIKQGCSYRDVAKWLSATTENPISHVGLFLRMKKEIRDKRSKTAKEAYQRKYGTQTSSAPETS